MTNAHIEIRDGYIYTKFSKQITNDDISSVASQAKEYMKDDPTLRLIIDDSDLRYKDLTAANKMASLEALKLVNSSPRTGVVIAEEDEKLLHYAKFALSYSKVQKVKLTNSLDEAIDWVTADAED